MCGRYTLTRVDYDDLTRSLGVEATAEQRAVYKPRYNIAPTDPCWIVHGPTGSEEVAKARVLEQARWGLVNWFAKDLSRGAMQINARAETVATAKAYRDAFAKRRCLVPADGYFEWTGAKKARQPVWFHRPEGGIFVFAGLFEDWRDPQKPKDDPKLRSFTILTTDARGRVLNVHDRMPLILAPDLVEAWLFGEPKEAEEVVRKSAALDVDTLLIPTEVSPKANSVKNDDPSVLEPKGAADAKGQGSLF